MPGYDDLLQEAEATLDRVDTALKRLADGSYGTCAQCGAPIGEERLSMLPTADLCESHQTELQAAE